MKRIFLYIALLFVSAVALAQTDSLAVNRHYDALAHWELGNKAYTDGDFARAVEEYQAIVEEGEYSLKLYYNLANAYFKLGELGEAILYYNRALRIAPANDDVRHNLALAEAQTKDRIAEVPEFFLNRWLHSVANSMSCLAWSVLSLVALALVAIFVLLFLLASQLSKRKVGFYGALVSLVLFVGTTAFALSVRSEMLERNEAVVMASAVSIKSSPDRSATDIFVLHEGTMVNIVSEVDEWREITIADGKKGWVEAKNIEQI